MVAFLTAARTVAVKNATKILNAVLHVVGLCCLVITKITGRGAVESKKDAKVRELPYLIKKCVIFSEFTWKFKQKAFLESAARES